MTNGFDKKAFLEGTAPGAAAAPAAARGVSPGGFDKSAFLASTDPAPKGKFREDAPRDAGHLAAFGREAAEQGTTAALIGPMMTVGAGLGALTSPVTGPVGPIVGGLGGAGLAVATPWLLEHNLPTSLTGKLGFTPAQREAEQKLHPWDTRAADVPFIAADVLQAGKAGLGIAAKKFPQFASKVEQSLVGRGFKAVTEAPGRVVRDIKTAISPSSEIAKLGKATDRTAVGKTLRERLTDRLEKLRADRETQFQRLKKDYLKTGYRKEAAIRDDLRKSLADERARLERQRNFDTDDAEAWAEITAKLDKNPGILKLEDERRELNLIAKREMNKVQSGRAQNYKTAKKLAGLFENAIRKQTGKVFDRFTTGYRDLSKEINEFNESALGSKAIDVEGDHLPDVGKVPDANLPGAFFKNQSSIEMAKRLGGGDKAAQQFVEQQARQHAINDIQGMNAPQIESYVRSHTTSSANDWLNAVPTVRDELKGLAARLRAGETIRGVAKKTVPYGIGAGLVGAYEYLKGD